MNKRHLELTAPDRKDLEALLSKGQLSARKYKRATGLRDLVVNQRSVGNVM